MASAWSSREMPFQYSEMASVAADEAADETDK